MSVISENILNRMWSLNMSQDELAKKVGYKSRTSINNIVNGTSDPPFSRMSDFAAALKTTPAALCGWDTCDDADDGQNGYNLYTLGKRLKSKGFNVETFPATEETIDYIIKTCKGKSVGIGDSIAFTQMGLVDALKETNGENLYPSEVRQGRETGKKAMTAEVFLTTVSAISYKTAEMVNISNRGSRIAGSLYYSDEIIFVVGKNKIAPDLTGALDRARNVYIPKVAKTVGYRTPCAETGKCEGCESPDRLCRTTCIYHNPPLNVPTTVILLDEELGF